MNTAIRDHVLIVVSYFAEVLADDTITDKVAMLRLAVLRKLMGQLYRYKERGFAESLLCVVAKKKGEFILETSSKTEMERVLVPRAPHFDGNRFVPDKYSIPEEELMAWSETSLKGPLVAEAFDRYRELFSIIFPKQAKEIFQEGA